MMSSLGRTGATVRDELGEVREHRSGGFAEGVRCRRVVRVLDAEAADRVAPLEDLQPVRLRDAEHFRDDLQGDLRGDCGYGVESTLVEHLVDDAPGDLADPLLQPADVAGGKGLVDQPTDLGVTRRVEAGEHRGAGGGRYLDEGVAGRGAEPFVVTARSGDVGMAGQQPDRWQ